MLRLTIQITRSHSLAIFSATRVFYESVGPLMPLTFPDAQPVRTGRSTELVGLHMLWLIPRFVTTQVPP